MYQCPSVCHSSWVVAIVICWRRRWASKRAIAAAAAITTSPVPATPGRLCRRLESRKYGAGKNALEKAQVADGRDIGGDQQCREQSGHDLVGDPQHSEGGRAHDPARVEAYGITKTHRKAAAPLNCVTSTGTIQVNESQEGQTNFHATHK
jgi:hypothetical protein